MGKLFRYKYPTTKRWYIRHKLFEHINFCAFLGYMLIWAMAMYWAFILLN